MSKAECALIDLAQYERSHEEARDDEKDVDADEAAFEAREPGVV